MAVTPEGGCEREIRVAPGLVSEPAEKPEAPDLAAVSWTDGDIARFLDRRARLLRWGWPEPDAEKLAEQLVRRDREADERVSCAECAHYRSGSCGRHKHALLQSSEVGRDFASMLQRCAGFTASGQGPK